MKSVRLIIPDLILPEEFAAEVVADLSLPALQKMLGRGRIETLEAVPLENILCETFGIPCRTGAPIAPIAAAFDGFGDGCWLRADPVHLELQRDRILLGGIPVSSEESALLCSGLNEHFAGQGMEFFAPHPLRWYLRLDLTPDIETTPLSAAIGGDMRKLLPTGKDAAHWHRIYNEIQMLLHAHPVNENREARGEPPINSVWLWGTGRSGHVRAERNFEEACSDDSLVEMLAASAGVPYANWPGRWSEATEGRQLLVWTGLRSALLRGDLAAWRAALQDFELGYAQPIWQALRSGKITSLRIDIPCRDVMRRVKLTRRDSWAFWRRSKRLWEYSLV